MLPDLNVACPPRIATGLARLEAHFAFRCACCMTVDMLTGERLYVAVLCTPHVASLAFADSER